jgi:hypothetical protein
MIIFVTIESEALVRLKPIPRFTSSPNTLKSMTPKSVCCCWSAGGMSLFGNVV